VVRNETGSAREGAIEVPLRGGGKLCSAVTADIGRRIVSGSFKPDQSLPTEAEMCIELGVSRTTLREAVKRLHGKGLVVAHPRRGTRVLATQHWNQFDAEVLAWRVEAGITPELLDHLYEIRDCFEPRACSLAATRGAEADRVAIREHFAEIVAATNDTERRIAADLAFHLAIFAATGNPYLVSLGSAIRAALHVSFSLSQQRSPIPYQELRLHGKVCHAILCGDGVAAQQSMRLLLDASRATLGLALHESLELTP
jgi:DNA-binding FadR family transcriptional regulator